MPESGIFEREDESVRVITVKKTFSSLFDHYYWHDSQLIEFCLYEYFKLVTVKLNTLTSDIHFLSEHLNYETHVQSYSEKQSADTFTVILTDSLSENQTLENSICGDHSETVSMQNDLILILLTLLMPWNQLPSLFTMFNCTQQNHKEHCAEIWN